MALAAVNASGVRATVAVSGVLAVMVVVALVTIDVAGAGAPPPALEGSAAGVLPAATLLFYAFAGYARVATLGGTLTAGPAPGGWLVEAVIPA